MSRTEAQTANRRVIEAELRNFHQTKRELELLREEIIESGYGICYDSMKVSGGTLCKPTESKAMMLLTSTVIRESERRVRAISELIDVLRADEDPTKLRFIELKYFERRYTDYGLAQQLNIGIATLYRWQNHAVHFIAERLGYIV
jgi:RinA family phage transcriptional activator